MVKIINGKAYALVISQSNHEGCRKCVAYKDQWLCNKLGFDCFETHPSHWALEKNGVEIVIDGRVYAPQPSSAEAGCALCDASIAEQPRTICTRLVKHQILEQKLTEPCHSWHYTCARTTD